MEVANGYSGASKADILRGIVAEKLTTAAQEILAVVERTVAGYEEEASGLRLEIDRQRMQLEDLLQPQIKLETIDDQFPVCDPMAGGGAEEVEQHKYEPPDQFPVCLPVAGRGAEEEEQQNYEQLLENQNLTGCPEVRIEEDVAVEEELRTDPVCQAQPRGSTRSVLSGRRSSSRPRFRASQDHINLRVRVLEDSNVNVLSVDVFRRYPVQEVQVPRGLKEEDFLDLLRSALPQLADGRSFEVFTADSSKKLQPLKVETLTAEEIYKSFRASGLSALYVRLKTPQEVHAPDGELHPSRINNAAESPSTDLTRLSSPRGQSDRRKTGRNRSSEPQSHVDLKIRILEDSQIDVLSPNVFQTHPMLELQCPRGMEEVDFLELLRSTFPQLADGRPFDFFTIDRMKRLQPLRLEALTPEEIYKSTRQCRLYIQLKTHPEVQARDGDIPQRRESDSDPPSLNQTTARVQSDRSSDPQNHIDLRICILEDFRIDVVSANVFRRYPVQEMRCPRGLQEEDFLCLLRSTFPRLAEPFHIFTTDRRRKLQPLSVAVLTPEEMDLSIHASGSSTLYFRLKEEEEVLPTEEEHQEYSLSSSDCSKLNMSRETPASPELSDCWDLLSCPGESEAGSPRLMQDSREELKEMLGRTLSDLSEEMRWRIISRLQTSGFTCREDFKYIQQEHLTGLLPETHLQKILNTLRSEAELVELDLEVISSSSPLSATFSMSELPTTSPGSSSPLSAIPLLSSQRGNDPSSGPSLTQMMTWPESFQVPWDRMPPEIRAAVVDGKRPKPTERRHMVRILVEEMRRMEPNPTRSQCLTVVRKIIRQYPKTFADMKPDGSLLTGGYTSLLIQVKNRIENLNRGMSFVRHRAPRSGLTQARPPSERRRRTTDSYGCIRFEPPLPPHETLETMEQRRLHLEEIYSEEGLSGAERSEVKHLMVLTFWLQRQNINEFSPPDVEDIRRKWPFLFAQTFLYRHFELLTDTNVLRSLEVTMAECGQSIGEYFRRKPTNKHMQDVLCSSEGDDLPLRVLQLLMAHFGEELSGLVLLADASSTAADVEMTFALPASPRLILLGETGQITVARWMVSVQHRVMSENGTATFLTGLAAVFAMFYIFNLRYQEEATCTLEFIQRRFIGINPERGTKAVRGKVVSKKTGGLVQKKLAVVNPHVSTLLKNLTDFEWGFM